jgi:hypothetical protein
VILTDGRILPEAGDSGRRHFRSLERHEQVHAIGGMWADGHTETTIATATGLSVEAVRAVLAEVSPA